MLKQLFELYFTFFKIGAVTFGGGYAMLPILERELAIKKKWVTSEDLLDYYAIAQVTPGIIAVNVATFVGVKQKGIKGGIFATLGIICPSIIIISLISLFISNFQDIIWVQKALSGINVAVAALLTYAVFNFAKKSVKNWWSLILYALAFCAVYFLKVSSVLVVIVSAVIGIIIHVISTRGKKE